MVEICCGSYYDAMEAAKGGAKRVELNCGLFMGGLTPSIASLELIKENCDLTVIAMVRPRGGGFCYQPEEFEVMLQECKELLEHGADGIAFGCLRADASIDTERCRQLLSVIQEHGKEGVFHRAFDCTPDPRKAIETLIRLKADRVLTSGQKNTAAEGLELLKDLQASYGQEIQLLAGSGVNSSNARMIMEHTGIRQIHSSCKLWKQDPTTNIPNQVSYQFAPAPYENCYDTVSADRVRELIASVEEI